MVNVSVNVRFVLATNSAEICWADTVYFTKPGARLGLQGAPSRGRAAPSETEYTPGWQLPPMRVTKSGASGSCGYIGRCSMPSVPAMTSTGPAPLVYPPSDPSSAMQAAGAGTPSGMVGQPAPLASCLDRS